MSVFAAIPLSMMSGILMISPQFPSTYRIEASLDTSTHTISGTEKIAFMNPTSDTLHQICFHLYPNAFKDTSTVFAREDDETRRMILAGRTSDLTVSHIIINGNEIAAGNISERGTLLYLDLQSGLFPHDTLQISLDFDLKVPPTLTRFGYDRLGNYVVSHWFPILCGYQDGRLVDNEFHANSEFFSNFSSYDVLLSIPRGFKITSTGELTMAAEGDSTATWQAHADSVIDFAFACGPAFEEFESDTLGVKIRYLVRKENVKLRNQVDDMVKLSLGYFSEVLFKYPYHTFTVVDAPIGAGGIELPGMIVLPLSPSAPGAVRRAMQNITIVHETAHQWFYACVASNEAEEPWLDEGLATYLSSRFAAMHGDTLSQFSFFGYAIDINEIERTMALAARAEYPIGLKSWDYPDMFSYNVAVYERGILVLQALENLMGTAKFDSAMMSYARAYRFGHPNASDFKSIMSRASGKNLDSFFEQFVEGTSRVDFSIRALEFRPRGLGGRYEVSVVLGRELEGVLPQKVTLLLDDKSRIDTTWDGVSRTAVFKFESASKPLAAILNDDAEYSLDENRSNNSFYVKSFGSRLLSFEWDFIFLKEFFLSLLL